MLQASPVLDAWIGTLYERSGSDLLLTADSPPRMRVDGALTPLDGAPVLTEDDVNRIVHDQLGDALGRRFDEQREVDFSFSWQGRARLRGNAFHQRGSAALAMRIIPMQIPTMPQLGLPPVVAELIAKPHGLILVTGATGSGKSTTLAAMVDYINSWRPCHILTIEDPIEYVHHNKQAAVTQREIGDDSQSFPRALRSALREDPDVLLVGEMRDPESISAALTIAETGHLVLATLHTNDSAQAIDRIVDVFSADARPQIQVQLAATLLGVIYQRLLPRTTGGRVAACEVMVANASVRNLIREGKTRQLRNVTSTHLSEGSRTLERSLNELVAAGYIDYQTALAASLYPKEISAPPPPTPVAAGPDPSLRRR
jgi:twitching motility protein PilT